MAHTAENNIFIALDRLGQGLDEIRRDFNNQEPSLPGENPIEDKIFFIEKQLQEHKTML
jgi:hypothetical protein